MQSVFPISKKITPILASRYYVFFWPDNNIHAFDGFHTGICYNCEAMQTAQSVRSAMLLLKRKR